jgi:hypothetical protein
MKPKISTAAILTALAVIFASAYIYMLYPLDYPFKIAALFSSAIGIVFYHALFAAPTPLSYRLLAITPRANLKTPKKIKYIVLLTRSIVALCVVSLFIAALALLPTALTVFASFDNENARAVFIDSAIKGAFLGLAIFVCALNAFCKLKTEEK